MEYLQDHGSCSYCGETALVYDRETGEEVCENCGLVVSERGVNTGPEWRAFTSAENSQRARAGTALSYTLFDMGLSTGFSGYRDGRGNHLPFETVNRMSRLRRHDSRSKLDETWRRNLSIAMVELERMTDEVHIPPSVKEQAAVIYRKALRLDLIRGRSIEAFVAASIHAACRLNRIPRSLKNIAGVSTRRLEEVSKTYRLLIQELRLKMPIDDPMKYVSGIASRLEVRPETERYAVELLRRAKKRRGLSGKDPRGVAAAALYMACTENGDKKKQKDVAAAANTTEVTLRNRMKGLKKVLMD